IQSNTVIGADGFGYLPEENGYKKIPQLGNVILEDGVEIGSNCVIDRAVMGSTILREGAKLDNLIQIGHNVEVGKHTILCAQVGIAGSSKIGEWSQLGGQVGVAGHFEIASRTKVRAKSGIGKSIKKSDLIIGGNPAMELGKFNRSYVVFRNLPSLQQRIENIENELKKDHSK
ncbi:MAG: UDP-3-O-(3-hydroxymyristoyl)glucosamine N-acyltransferase, partial [Bacteroidota bacterium]